MQHCCCPHRALAAVTSLCRHHQSYLPFHHSNNVHLSIDIVCSCVFIDRQLDSCDNHRHGHSCPFQVPASTFQQTDIVNMRGPSSLFSCVLFASTSCLKSLVADVSLSTFGRPISWFAFPWYLRFVFAFLTCASARASTLEEFAKLDDKQTALQQIIVLKQRVSAPE